MTYTHISWFNEKQIEKARNENRIIIMCSTCGASPKDSKKCPNCDINMKEYIYHEELKEVSNDN